MFIVDKVSPCQFFQRGFRRITRSAETMKLNLFTRSVGLVLIAFSSCTLIFTHKAHAAEPAEYCNSGSGYQQPNYGIYTIGVRVESDSNSRWNGVTPEQSLLVGHLDIGSDRVYASIDVGVGDEFLIGTQIRRVVRLRFDDVRRRHSHLGRPYDGLCHVRVSSVASDSTGSVLWLAPGVATLSFFGDEGSTRIVAAGVIRNDLGFLTARLVLEFEAAPKYPVESPYSRRTDRRELFVREGDSFEVNGFGALRVNSIASKDNNGKAQTWILLGRNGDQLSGPK